MEDYKKKSFIILSLIRGIGPVGQHLLLGILGDPETCLYGRADEIKEKLDSCGCPKRYSAVLLKGRNYPNLSSTAEQILDECDKKKITVVTAADCSYPNRFCGIKQMPEVLYVKGQLRVNEFESTVGIIGARRCTHEGKAEAIRITEKAVAANKAVISGMAKGIDSYAHTAAIKAGGYTIAVLGNGPDICYPEEHRKLYESICEAGCILSEIPPGIKPRQYMFPRRNRLIAALSDELYVIDAGRNSGTESTIETAEIYNRIVIRGDPYNKET